jgi:hypothetical protein
MRGRGAIEAKQAAKAPSISFHFLPFPSLSFRESSFINGLRGNRAKKKNSSPTSRSSRIGPGAGGQE